MSKKKMSYIDLLKEAVSNYPGYDTSKTTDSKGPFVDGIVSYEGDGEMVTYKDASGILERYYFDKEEGIENIHEQHEEEPAGADYSQTIDQTKDEIVKKVTEDDETEEDYEEVEESEDLTETEKSIVEKLIEEMEEEVSESEEVSETTGTQPAGKGDAEKYIPEAEDKEETEDEEDLDVDKELEEWGTGLFEDEDKDDEEDEKDDDDDDEEKEEVEETKKAKGKKAKATNEAGPVGGPLGKNKSSGKKKGQYEDEDELDVLEEQFSLFKKQIMESDEKEEDVEDIKGKDVIV